jgi:hypothetical protein
MEEDTKKWLYYGVPAAIAVAIGVALFYGRSHRQAEQQQASEPPPAVTQPETTPATEPPVRNPLEEAPPPEPLPPLAESDPKMLESLGSIFGKALDPFLVPKDIIRHTVVTIDNLPRKKTAVQMWPVKPLGGELIASGEGDRYTLSAENFARYERPVKILQNVDMARLVAFYKQFYPLFQEAYVAQGYPDGYFNDRLVEVIDHLLATPEVSEPIVLVRPSVTYRFADPELENRSAGQKLLIRMGSANAAIVKDKLRELRQAIASQQPAPG